MNAPAPDGPSEIAAAGLAEAPIVLIGSRSKIGRVAAFSVVFIAVGFWEARQPGEWHGMPIVAIGVGASILGMLGAAVAILQLFRPPTLTLSSTGLMLATVTRSFSIRWAEVERFHPWRPSTGGSALVGYTRRGAPRSKMESLSRGLGCDGAIPDQFPISSPALLSLCEACRRRWG